jgi:hypothetical protein
MTNASLPAAPLVAIVDRVVRRAVGEVDTSTRYGQRAGRDLRESALARMRLDPRALHAWRSGERKTVTLAAADRVLSTTEYLWFDVWPECPYHPEPALGCVHCHTHCHARFLFTGDPLPQGFGRNR